MLLRRRRSSLFSSRTLFFFFFNDTATTEIYTLSLHDALPISPDAFNFKQVAYYAPSVPLQYIQQFLLSVQRELPGSHMLDVSYVHTKGTHLNFARSEEHTSELQSRSDLVCRLLLEKKKKQHTDPKNSIQPKDQRAYHPTVISSHVRNKQAFVTYAELSRLYLASAIAQSVLEYQPVD